MAPKTTGRKRWPVALTIAGSDSGGGAGIQADLRTFAAHRVHGTSAITCVTAQNPAGVRGIQACTPRIVREQIEAVMDQLEPAAIKTGMLFSRAIIREVVGALSGVKHTPLVVDPVMVASSGARLLRPDAIRELTCSLFPLATLLTPNMDEAAVLMGRRLRNVDDLRAAARELHGRWGCALLVKGGHLRGLREAADIYYDGGKELLLTAPFVKGVSTHGTGCTYSAAITAGLARGRSLETAVRAAKVYITRAIAGSISVGRHQALGWEL